MLRLLHCCSLLTFPILLLFGLGACGKQDKKPLETVRVSTNSTSAIEFTDASGKRIHLKYPAIKVVSLLPGLTEFMFQLDKGHLLVGRSAESRCPVEALDIPVVGTQTTVDTETILALKPNVVLAGKSLIETQVEELESQGLPIVILNQENWDGLVRDLEALGQILGNPGDVKTLLAWLGGIRKSIMVELEETNNAEPVKTTVLSSIDPLNAAGPDAWVNELVQLAGGTNLATGASTGSMLSLETMLADQPEVLLISSSTGSRSELTEKLRGLREQSGWGQLNALRNNKVYLLDYETLTIPGPRQIEAIRQIAAALHPDLFEAPDDLVHLDLR